MLASKYLGLFCVFIVLCTGTMDCRFKLLAKATADEWWVEIGEWLDAAIEVDSMTSPWPKKQFHISVWVGINH